MRHLAGTLFGDDLPSRAEQAGDPEVTLLDWDPDAEIKVVAAMLYPYTHLPEHRIQERVAAMSEEERLAWCAPMSAIAATGATGPAGPSSGGTTASTSSPTTAPSGTCNATGCSPWNGRT